MWACFFDIFTKSFMRFLDLIKTILICLLEGLGCFFDFFFSRTFSKFGNAFLEFGTQGFLLSF